MPQLGDFIGALLSEMTLSRMSADLESLRLAEVYKSHPLLKHMPVPRFRLPEITIDVPVIVSGMTEGDTENKPFALRRPDDEKLERMVNESLESANLKLTAPNQKKLLEEMKSSTEKAWKDPRVKASSKMAKSTISKSMSNSILKGDMLDKNDQDAEAKLKDAGEILETRLQNMFVEDMNKNTRITALVNSSQIKEINDDSVVAHIKMTIHEESYEMVMKDEEDETTTERFIPE